jgi:hypothetical protein
MTATTEFVVPRSMPMILLIQYLKACQAEAQSAKADDC